MTEPTPQAPYQPQDPSAVPGQYPPAPGQYAPVPGQYAPAPGQYPPAPGQYAPGQYPPVVQPPKKKSRRPIVLSIVGVVVLVLIIVGFIASRSDPDNAKVGSCMAGTTADTLKITDCTNTNATWTVVGKVTTKDEPTSDAAGTDCDPFPTATADFYKGDSSGGYVLCLAPKA